MSDLIAVINAGSSSVKFAIYQATRDERCLFRGQVEGIGVAPRLEVTDDKGGVVEDRILPAQGFDHDATMREIIETGRALLKEGSSIALGHRVVHGGLDYAAPVRVTETVLDDLAKLEPLRAFASAAQPRPHPRDHEGRAADTADRLLRHGLPSRPIPSGSGVRSAAALL